MPTTNIPILDAIISFIIGIFAIYHAQGSYQKEQINKKINTEIERNYRPIAFLMSGIISIALGLIIAVDSIFDLFQK